LRFHKGFPAKANSDKVKKFFKKRQCARKKFLLPTPGTVQELDWFFLLLSIYTLKEDVYGRKKKKSISLPHWARSGKREMYFFRMHFPCFA